MALCHPLKTPVCPHSLGTEGCPPPGERSGLRQISWPRQNSHSSYLVIVVQGKFLVGFFPPTNQSYIPKWTDSQKPLTAPMVETENVTPEFFFWWCIHHVGQVLCTCTVCLCFSRRREGLRFTSPSGDDVHLPKNKKTSTWTVVLIMYLGSLVCVLVAVECGSGVFTKRRVFLSSVLCRPRGLRSLS